MDDALRWPLPPQALESLFPEDELRNYARLWMRARLLASMSAVVSRFQWILDQTEILPVRLKASSM